MDRAGRWNGTGTIGPDSLTLFYSVATYDDKGGWPRPPPWDESINLMPF
jgi:hypothetical protein